MKGFDNSLKELFDLIYKLEARKTEFLSEHVAADLLKKELPALIKENWSEKECRNRVRFYLPVKEPSYVRIK